MTPARRGTFSKIAIRSGAGNDDVHTKPGVDSVSVTGTTNQLIGFTSS